MTILNSLATYTNQYILLFGIFASTTVYLVYSLIKTIRDNSNNSNSETNIPNLHDPKIQGLLEYFSKEIQENKITEAEIVPVVQCLDLSELYLHDIYEIVHGIFCFCFFTHICFNI